MKFARLHRQMFDPLVYTGDGLWVNFEHVAAMCELAQGGTRLLFPTEDKSPVAGPRVSPLDVVPLVANAMQFVMVDVIETIPEILATIA